MKTKTITYADSGVNIDRAEKTKKRIGALAKRTFTPQVLAGIGGFGALYGPNLKGLKSPVLVSSADGVGTKLKVAFATGRHRSAAADLVNHCVNDIAVQGARPLYFLDYIGSGRIEPSVIEQIVSGLADACRAHGCALIGGETAEMPGFYADGEYDLAGFITGIVDKKKVINGAGIRPGDVLLGLPSVGLHTNGYSLARKLLLETAGYKLDEFIPRLGCTVADELLKPHRSYAKAIFALNDAGLLKGAAHITGGGITGNLPRIFPKGIEARITRGSWPELPLYGLLRAIGNVPENDMSRTFNMGIGMILVVAAKDLAKTTAVLKKAKEKCFQIGTTAKGTREVVYL
ncbi:MAG: phosphoribosylformylglycinamidine cyclo-ligase [Acidobacteria bacterium]|nr:phosphoribosylformylglycinamidine cyclo-ligase [Acidobacteriota bacterium]